MPKDTGYPAGTTGTKGQGYKGESKYDAANAPVVKNGGNSAIQDGVRSETAPKNMPNMGSYKS